jgi:hypothetical protein
LLANGLLRAAFLGGLAALLPFLRSSTGRRAGMIGGVWLALLAGDLLTHMRWQNPTVARDMLTPNMEHVSSLKQAVPPGHSRMMSSLRALGWFHQSTTTNIADSYMAARLGVSHNVNLLDGLPKANGFFSLYINEQQEVEHRVFRDDENMFEPIANVMSISLTTAPGKLFDWAARTNYLPVVSIGQQPNFLHETNILEAMLDTNFNPAAMVFLPLSAKPDVSAMRQKDAKAVVEKFKPHEIMISVDTPGTAMVIISQSFYKPWKAYIDGVAAPVWRANHAFQAVQVGAGQHRLELRYEDRMFRIGAWLSMAAAMGALICVLRWPACRRAFLSTKTS